jgi:hypothetical protein
MLRRFIVPLMIALLCLSAACTDVKTGPGLQPPSSNPADVKSEQAAQPKDSTSAPVDEGPSKLPAVPAQPAPSRKMIYGMKGVAIDLPKQDFIDMKDAGIDIVATEWGMEEDVGKARTFLDRAQAAGLKVVLDGGFSYSAWGFTNDDWDHLPPGKKPVWQKYRVQAWIQALKDHPAIYAWDICNEFGENLPSGAGMKNSDWPDSMITIDQIKRAQADVLDADNTRPIHVRMYEWDVENTPSHVRALLDNKIADIISLNLYSNYLEHGKLQWPTVISDIGADVVDAIKQKEPDVKVWVSIAAFEYPRMFQRPTTDSLRRDINDAAAIKNIDGLTFFCWGPVSQWDEKCDWYLPTKGVDLWQIIKSEIARLKQAR